MTMALLRPTTTTTMASWAAWSPSLSLVAVRGFGRRGITTDRVLAISSTATKITAGGGDGVLRFGGIGGVNNTRTSSHDDVPAAVGSFRRYTSSYAAATTWGRREERGQEQAFLFGGRVHRTREMIGSGGTGNCRYISTNPRDDADNKDDDRGKNDDVDEIFIPEGMNISHRHDGIVMNPNSISRAILPGNVVTIMNRNKVSKQRYTELAHGYFWMLKDLRLSDEKPVLSNGSVIPERDSKAFPAIGVDQRLTTLSGVDVGSLPDAFLKRNRSNDAHAQCTVLCVGYRDYGYQILSQWVEPYRSSPLFSGGGGIGTDRVSIVKMCVSEGWMNRTLLRPIIKRGMRSNTPEEEHDDTVLWFPKSNDADYLHMRDSLRMHNIMTGYVFLLDGVGRVRFAGSGPPTEQEIDNLVRFTKDILKPAKRTTTKPKRHHH